MFLIMGMPGSGKTVQSQRIRDTFGFSWVSTGELFRSSDNPEIKSIIDRGELVSDEVTNKEVLKVLSVKSNKPFLLDGYPRNFEQAKHLLKMSKLLLDPVVAIIYLSLSEEVATNRLIARGRADDTDSAIEKRKTQSLLLGSAIAELKRHRVRYHSINADQPEDEVFDEVSAVINCYV